MQAVTLKIQGADLECNCDHCGRNLKIGIQLEGFGIIGADCLSKVMIFDRKKYSQGRLDAATLRKYATMKQNNSVIVLERMGYYSSAFEVSVDWEKLKK